MGERLLCRPLLRANKYTALPILIASYVFHYSLRADIWQERLGNRFVTFGRSERNRPHGWLFKTNHPPSGRRGILPSCNVWLDEKHASGNASIDRRDHWGRTNLL